MFTLAVCVFVLGGGGGVNLHFGHFKVYSERDQNKTQQAWELRRNVFGIDLGHGFQSLRNVFGIDGEDVDFSLYAVSFGID